MNCRVTLLEPVTCIHEIRILIISSPAHAQTPDIAKPQALLHGSAYLILYLIRNNQDLGTVIPNNRTTFKLAQESPAFVLWRLLMKSNVT